MAVTNFRKLPYEKQLLVVKRYIKNNGGNVFEAITFLFDENPIISVWRNGKLKIHS